MNKAIIAIVVVVVLILGYYYFTTAGGTPVVPTTPSVQNTQTTPTTPKSDPVAVAPKTKHTVNYTDKGYTEKALTIKAGESVVFINNSTHPLMTAFGEHASHDEYPDKKAHVSIDPGMSDSITFPNTGTYDYHNHHAEDDTGTIIVE